jgi:hypothetical protein
MKKMLRLRSLRPKSYAYPLPPGPFHHVSKENLENNEKAKIKTQIDITSFKFIQK